MVGGQKSIGVKPLSSGKLELTLRKVRSGECHVQPC